MNKILLFTLLFCLELSTVASNQGTPRPNPIAPHGLQQKRVSEINIDSFTVSISRKDLIISLTTFENVEVSASLMSIVGQKVGQWKWQWDDTGKQTKKLSIEEIPSGIYIFTMKIGDKNLSRKLIV
ncbi:MAG: T9SS type A sorting domain-containing protein [Schleiferiaceae bacterium]|nr:T9SS type A sorting domain-containing protein [Schleiferiaceae bacterium]